MADFSALKTSIQNYIKQNGNEEITGNLLQQILLSMVTTLGDSAINDLVTALNAEIANRGNADTELSGRITTLQGVVNGIKANVENGYVYAGIATTSTTPVSGKVFYLALTAGTYTNFGATVVPQGINILKYNGSAWSLDSFLGLDDAPTQGSNNLVKSGGVLDSIIKNGSAFDLSAYNNGTTYADLSAALTALNALPAAYKKGGMSFKYVQTYDNKYVQWRLMSDSFNTTESNWQGVDDEPIIGSKNLVESGGVYDKFTLLLNKTDNYFCNKGHLNNTGEFISSVFGEVTDFIKIPQDVEEFKVMGASQYGNVPSLCTYDKNGNFVKAYYVDDTEEYTSTTELGFTTLTISSLQYNEVYFRARRVEYNVGDNYFGDYQSCRLQSKTKNEIEIDNFNFNAELMLEGKDFILYDSYRMANKTVGTDTGNGQYKHTGVIEIDITKTYLYYGYYGYNTNAPLVVFCDKEMNVLDYITAAGENRGYGVEINFNTETRRNTKYIYCNSIQQKLLPFKLTIKNNYPANELLDRSCLPILSMTIIDNKYITPTDIVEQQYRQYAEVDVTGWYGVKVVNPYYIQANGFVMRFLDSERNLIKSLGVNHEQNMASCLVPPNAVYAQFNIRNTLLFRVFDEPATKINNGFLYNIAGWTDGYITANGVVMPNSVQHLTKYLKIPYINTEKTSIQEFVILNILRADGDDTWGGIHFYDKDYNWLGRIMTNFGRGAAKITYDIIPAGAEFFRFSPYPYTFPSALCTMQLEEFEGFENNYKKPSLYGKTWVCFGDSFSHGDFTNSSTPASSYNFQGGEYSGQHKVYSRFIAQRNNMKLQLLAQNGASVGMLPTDTQYSNPDYNPETDAPSNTVNLYWGQMRQVVGTPDYITLWFGINDTAHCELGTINDETVKTFYGALNWCLLKLITNYPKAHIGLIVSNGGIGSSFAQAIRDCGQKWGVPYLEMKANPQVPTIFGDREGQSVPIDSRVAQIKRNAFYVNAQTNGHPNEFAHEYESVFIEEWMKSL